MRIAASRPAVRYIQRKGSDIFVWFGSVGDVLFEHVGTSRPDGREFDVHHSHDGIRVWIERRRGIAPIEIHLRRRPWPMGPIEVTWEGGPGGELGPVNLIGASGH